jgi:hypothetical protein
MIKLNRNELECRAEADYISSTGRIPKEAEHIILA